MKENLKGLTRKDVQATMKRIEPQESYSAVISSQLQETVFGQKKAMDAIARRLALFDTGLSDPKRPLGVMMFLGPSGVGKTEASRAASKQMFGDTHSERLKIINMAEMSEGHDTKKFVGSPPSYVGHSEKPIIAHDWLHKGRNIIVLDELEKAHPAVRQLFLGAFDTGRMDSRNGQAGVQPLDFRNTLFVITSNIGGNEMHDVANGTGGIGFKVSEPSEKSKQKRIQTIAERGLKDTLSPEFLNRIDDIVVFQEITDRNVHAKIFDKFVDYRNQDIASTQNNPPCFGTTLEFKEHVLDTVGNKGGREMKRELERQLFDKAADVFMGMDVKGRPLVADYDVDTGSTVFYTDEITLLSEAEKKEPVTIPVATPDAYPADFTGELPPDSSGGNETTEKKTQTAGEKPNIEQGDNGDEKPPELRIGIKMLIWDESMVNPETGWVPQAYVAFRNLPIPKND